MTCYFAGKGSSKAKKGMPCRLFRIGFASMVIIASLGTWEGGWTNVMAQKDVEVDHYAALELTAKATQREIRTAYKKLSLKYHPDKHAGKDSQADAQRRFSEISAAYETLGDPDKRAMYDDFGGQEFTNKRDAQRAGVQTDRGFYSGESDIVALKSYMFDGWTFSGERARGPLSKKDTWVFEFYTPWCVHCQHMVPHFKKLARRLTSETLGFGAANCEEDQRVCRTWQIHSYPTLIFVSQRERIEEIYEGEHSTDAIAEFVREMSLDAVETLAPNTWDAKVARSKSAWFVLFNAGSWCGPCVSAKSKFRKFAARIHPNARAGVVDCDRYGSFCQDYGVQSYPHYRTFAPGQSSGGEQLFSPRQIGPDMALDFASRIVKLMGAASSATASHSDDLDLHDEL